MIIISKSRSIKQPFIVTYKAKNGETLSTSELLKSKKAAFKNIYSHALIFCSTLTNPEIELEIKVWDKTIVGSKPFGYGLDGLKKKAGVRK